MDRDDALAAASGNSGAFERLYARHSPKVYGLATWMGAPGESEDLTQEIFLMVWRKAHTWNGSAEFSTWLRRLSVNVILSHRRVNRSKPLELSLESGNEAIDEPGRSSSPELRLTIETAIERLPATMRDVFVLHDVEGYTHDEIARLLDIEPGTSASRLHRARMLLKEVLRDI